MPPNEQTCSGNEMRLRKHFLFPSSLLQPLSPNVMKSPPAPPLARDSQARPEKRALSSPSLEAAAVRETVSSLSLTCP